MNYRQSILEVIGSKGKAKEQSFFDYANEEPNKHAKDLILIKAHEYAKMRKSYITAVKQGEYAKYGITADDIVE